VSLPRNALLGLIVCAVLCLPISTTRARAAGRPTFCDTTYVSNCEASAHGGDGIDVLGQAPRATGSVVSDSKVLVAPASGSVGPERVRALAPACSGNSPADPGLLCGAATTTCPKPGDVAFWTWTAVLDPKTGKQTPWVLQTNPLTVCMGAAAPGVPKAVVIRATVEREFKRLVVLKGVATPQPAGKTLVNFDTAFYTRAAAYQLPPITIVGSTVRVRASPARYDWHFGDGTQLADRGPGAKDTEQVTHRYTSTGRVGPYVVVTWSGTYKVDGDPAVQQVNGQAVTTGNPAALQVETAPSELVAH